MNPRREADPGLHHRPLRLIAAIAAKERFHGGPHRQLLRRRAPGSAPHHLRDGRHRREDAGRRDHALVRGDTRARPGGDRRRPRLDALQREIEERAILTIVRRQPMAVDLRETVVGDPHLGDLERIGDLAKNIAKRVLAISGQFQPQKIVAGVQHMSDLVLGAAQGRARRLRPEATTRPRSTSGSATARSTRSTPRCSASSSPT